MESRQIPISAEMKQRIKKEMAIHGQKNRDIADYLCMQPQSFSRIICGRALCAYEYLQRLANLWGIRENYLLCKDNIRTDNEFLIKIGSERTEKNMAISNLLKAYGYNIETVYLLAVSALDLSTLYFMDDELSFISQHIVSNTELWESITERAHVMKNNRECDKELFDDEKYYFEISDALVEKIKAEEDVLLDTDILEYVDVLTRIRKDGTLVGYIEKENSILKMMSDNAAQLFDSVIKINIKGVGYRYSEKYEI